MMTTAFPLAPVLMQLTSMLCARDLWLRLQWTPRTSNVEADDLTNEVFDKFEPSKRIMVSWDEVPQEVMGPLLLLGKSFMDEVAARRVVKLKLPAKLKPAKRRKVVDPWEA